MSESARASMIRARIDAPAHVQRMLEQTRERSGVSLERIRTDPIGWLKSWNEVEVIDLARSQATADDRCSVDGLYRGDPPRIGIAFSDTTERMNFSALHELGHHIQTTDEVLADALAVRHDGGEALEEIASDRFAAEILIPDHAAALALGTGVPRADDIVSLWKTLATVSRSVVAIRALRTVDVDAVVVILDSDGMVSFATSNTAIRPIRRSDQRSTPIWDEIQHMRTGGTVHTRTQFGYAAGLAGPVYFAHAARMGSGYVVVAATERVPWLPLAVARNEYVPNGTWSVCVHSGCAVEFFATTPPHELCGQPVCTECERCGCGVAARNEFNCAGCFSLKGRALESTTPGMCIDCT